MIVVSGDLHKASHTFLVVDAVTGRMRAERTVGSDSAGVMEALLWARGLDAERVWAIEDCRHVSGRLERFLLASGERVVRVAPRLMAGQRRSSRQRGKSDSIDALAVAQIAIREGIETLPQARLAGAELDLRLLVDHRDRLVVERGQAQQTLRWHLHDLYDDLTIPLGGLDRAVWLDKISRRLARDQKHSVRARLATDLVSQIRQHTKKITTLTQQISLLVETLCPQLLELRGCGPLTAAKLIAEIAGIDRFKTDAKLARQAGVAPIPASTGNTHRHRLDRGGNRQLNLALHRLAVNLGRHDPETRAYLQRKQAQGKTRREALRALKRHLTRRVWHLLQPQPPDNSLT